MNRAEYRRLRKSVGSQRFAAHVLGVDVMTVSRRERGVFPINREAALAMERIAEGKDSKANRVEIVMLPNSGG